MRKEKMEIYMQNHPSMCTLGNESMKHLIEITDIIPVQKYKVLLDIGCGNGSETFILKKLGYDVTGITRDVSNINYAKEHFSECRILEMDMCDLEFPSNSFDAIYMDNVYEHSLCPYIQLIEMYCILRPGGIIYTIMPAYSEISHHHPNILPLEIYRSLFSILFDIKSAETKKDINNLMTTFLLVKKPINQLHSDIQSTILKRKRIEF